MLVPQLDCQRTVLHRPPEQSQEEGGLSPPGELALLTDVPGDDSQTVGQVTSSALTLTVAAGAAPWGRSAAGGMLAVLSLRARGPSTQETTRPEGAMQTP